MSKEALLAACPNLAASQVQQLEMQGVSPADILVLVKKYGPEVADIIMQYGPIAAKAILAFVALLP